MSPEIISKIEKLKAELDSFRPFDQSQLKNLREWFRIGFIQNSNAIEWNSSTLSEVKVLLEDGITIGWKTVREIRETLNYGDVMLGLDNLFSDQKFKITESFVLKLHRDLMRGLLEKVECWTWRKINIYVTGSEEEFPLPSQVPYLMQEYFSSEFVLPKTIQDVAKIHFDFVKIHPFVDGNGRIARLLMNIGLIGIWYFPIVIPVAVRNEYISSLKDKHFESWFDFFVQQVYENHKDYVRFFSNN